MKKIIFSLFLFLSALSAQTPDYVWVSYNVGGVEKGKYILFTDFVAIVKANLPTRTYDVILPYDATVSGWKLPSTKAKYIVIYVNGLRYHCGTDFKFVIINSYPVVQPLSTNLLPSMLVTTDYSEAK